MANNEMCIRPVVNICDFDGSYSEHVTPMPCPEDCPGAVEVERAALSPLRLVLGPTRLACGMTVKTQPVAEA